MAWSVAACFASVPAWALPTGGQVVAGSASFNQIGNSLTVANTPGAIINWNAFSIGALEAVRFNQQNSLSSVLNRVTGGDASAILGSLSSNGRVFLINPNGILFGAGSRIDVNGLIASTLNLTDADFLAGRLNFTAGDSAGSIRNAGTLQASPGGHIYLVAPDIENSGIVRAPNGEVVLAAGRQVSLVDGGHPDIQIVVSAPDDKAVNLGEIAAGKIGVFGALLSQRGVVSADTVETDAAGRIVFRASQRLDLDAGSRTTANGGTGGTVVLQSAGDTYVKGTVEATGSQGTGGTLAALGNRVAVMDQAVLDASGQTGGGRIMVGGDYQGKNADVPNAQVSYFGPDATLKADAGKVGAGGTVIVWADDTTRAYGNISARGGSQGGDGGFVETSGKRYLDFHAKVDTRAPYGAMGTLLLDPVTVTIVIDTNATTGVSGEPDFTAGVGGNLNVSDLLTALGNSNVSVTAGDNLTVDAAIDDYAVSTPHDLALTATAGLLTVNAPITLASTNLSTTSGGTTTINAPISVGGSIALTTTSPAADIVVNSIVSGGSISATAGGSLRLASNYVESPAKLIATNGNITVNTGQDVVLEATGGSTDGGTALVRASGDVEVVAGGAVSLTADGGYTSATIESTGGHVGASAVGAVSLNARGGNYSHAGITSYTGNTTVQGDSISLTANFDGGEGVGAEIHGYNNATVRATGGGVQISALSSGNHAGIYIDGGSGVVAVESQNGVSLTSSGGGFAFISAEGGVDETVNVVAYGGDISLALSNCASSCSGSAEIYAYNNYSGSGAVNVEAKAGDITLTNDGIGTVGIDGGNGTTVRASGDITVAGVSGTLPYIGWQGGTTIQGLSLSLDHAMVEEETGDIHIEVGGNISLDHSSSITAAGDVYLTLKGADSILSLNDGSMIVSVSTLQGGGCGPNGCTTHIDFTKRASAENAITLDGTAYELGTEAVGSASSGIYYGADLIAAASWPTGEWGLVITSGIHCDAGWYCWDGGTTGDWSLLSNWTALGGGNGSDPGSIDWTNGQFKIGSGYSTVWDAYASSGSIAALSNSGTVTVAYGGPVSIGSLTLAGGQLLTSDALVSSLTIGTMLSMDATSLISGFPSIVKSTGNMTLGGNIYYAGALSLQSAGSIEGPATIQGVDSIDLNAQGNIGPVNIITPVVTATSQSGNVYLQGHSSAAPHALGATVTATNGSVTVLNYGALTLNGISAYGGVVSEAHSPLIVAGPVSSSNGSIALTSSGGDPLTVSSSGTVTSTAGGVSMTSGSGGAIVINGSVAAPSGGVTFAAGSAPSGTGSVTTSSGTTSGAALSTLSFTTTQAPTTGTTVPTLDACVANPALAGCSTVLPTLATCTSAPATPGCSAVLPTIDICISNPSTSGCAVVLPTIDICVSNPTAAGCTVVLPTLASCISAPATPGCSAVLPTISSCIGNPTTSGCSAVLPTLATCTSAPATPGCSVVLPTISTCISNPTASGCTAVLPTVDACVANPSAPGCTVVLPTLAACVIAPSTPGCSSVLPTLSVCITNPAAAGCAAVLPTLATCTTAPTTPGCSAVLPPDNLPTDQQLACLINPASCNGGTPSGDGGGLVGQVQSGEQQVVLGTQTGQSDSGRPDLALLQNLSGGGSGSGGSSSGGNSPSSDEGEQNGQTPQQGSNPQGTGTTQTHNYCN